MTTIKTGAKIKTAGIDKVSAKGDAKQLEQTVISDSFAEISDHELREMTKDVSIESIANKAKKSRYIWTEEARNKFNSETQSRGKLRSKQTNLSANICLHTTKNEAGQFPKIDRVSLIADCKKLENFYRDNLVDFSKYSSLAETSKNYATIHSAYKTMQKFI